MTTTRTTRLLLSLVTALAFAACGTPTDTPDGGGNTTDAATDTPDANDVTPDGGGDAPDGGGDTPDAGGGVPSFKVRLFNMSNGQSTGGDPMTNPPTFYLDADAKELTEYVDVPVGTSVLAFGAPPNGFVNVSSLVEGQKVTVGVVAVQNNIVARMMIETENTDATKRKFDFVTTLTSFGGVFGTQSFNVGAGENTSLLVDGETTGGWLGRNAEHEDLHIVTARIPLGGRGVIVNNSDDYYLLGAPGVQTMLPRDTKIRPLVLTGTPAPLDFKWVAPFGEGVFATGQNLTSAATNYGWVPGDATSLVAFNAGGESYAKANPFGAQGGEQPELASRYTLLVRGNPIELTMDPRSFTQSGGNEFNLYNAQADIRFRVSVLGQNNTALGWLPGPNLHVDPFGMTGVNWGSANGNFRLGFQISNPPNNPPSNSSPEPIIDVAGLPGYVEGYFYAWSSFRIVTVTNEGAISHHPPFAN